MINHLIRLSRFFSTPALWFASVLAQRLVARSASCLLGSVSCTLSTRQRNLLCRVMSNSSESQLLLVLCFWRCDASSTICSPLDTKCLQECFTHNFLRFQPCSGEILKHSALDTQNPQADVPAACSPPLRWGRPLRFFVSGHSLWQHCRFTLTVCHFPSSSTISAGSFTPEFLGDCEPLDAHSIGHQVFHPRRYLVSCSFSALTLHTRIHGRILQNPDVSDNLRWVCRFLPRNTGHVAPRHVLRCSFLRKLLSQDFFRHIGHLSSLFVSLSSASKISSTNFFFLLLCGGRLPITCFFLSTADVTSCCWFSEHILVRICSSSVLKVSDSARTGAFLLELLHRISAPPPHPHRFAKPSVKRPALDVPFPSACCQSWEGQRVVRHLRPYP